MQSRTPTTLGFDQRPNNGLRRRSGNTDYISISEADDDETQHLRTGQPTVVLVSRHRSRARSQDYSPLVNPSPANYHHAPPVFEAEDYFGFKPIPLTPRPEDAAHRFPSTLFVPSPGESENVRIPMLSQPQGLASFYSAQPYTGVPRSSVTRERSGKTTVPSDGADLDLPSVSSYSIAKFTQKWPRPKSFRCVTSPLHYDQLNANMDDELHPIPLHHVAQEKWTCFGWVLLVSIVAVFLCGAAGLTSAFMTWFRLWGHADAMYVADNDILILVTLASSILIFSSLIGMTGLFLNSRPILASYAILLWPGLIGLLSIGYVSYKRVTFALDHKLNLSWSQYYTPIGRLMIQNTLHCCGFYSALHEATPSKRCFARTALPGCKGKLYRFERQNLGLISFVAFVVVVVQLINILVALLCANHTTDRFGKGLTPKRYRLTAGDLLEEREKQYQNATG